MTLPDLKGKATLDVADFKAGVSAILSDLKRVTDVSKSSNTIRITAALSDTNRVLADVDKLRATTGKPVSIPVTLDAPNLNRTKGQLGEVDLKLKDLQGTVRTTRNLWQTQILSDQQAAQSSKNLLDELLRLAAAEGTTAEQITKATQAAAQAQRTLDQSQGQLTKGGFASHTELS